MRTIIFKPILLLIMIIGVAFVSINAGQAVGDGTIKIEVAIGFTIEDIIQDLQDKNVSANAIVVDESTSLYIVQFSAKYLDNTLITQYLEEHPGAVVKDKR